ncbi:hypothetical protein Tco_1378668 [Tanacetum coccineum]
MDNRDNRRLDVFGASIISRKHRILCDLGFTFYYFRMKNSMKRGDPWRVPEVEAVLEVTNLESMSVRRKTGWSNLIEIGAPITGGFPWFELAAAALWNNILGYYPINIASGGWTSLGRNDTTASNTTFLNRLFDGSRNGGKKKIEFFLSRSKAFHHIFSTHTIGEKSKRVREKKNLVK